MNITLQLILLLSLKHFIIDSPLQGPFQYRNKGTYAHAGGLLHSGLHGIGTVLVLCWYAPYASFIFGIVDFVVHYHIDWAKVNINKKLGWGPTTHEQFWWLLGLDQLLHTLTYIAFVCMITT